MSEKTQWLAGKIRLGWLTILAGAAVLAGSVAAQIAFGDPARTLHIVGGVGIALMGLGLGLLIRYGAAIRDEAATRRVVAEERDERSVAIRQRAGLRAYWTSAVLAFGGLMWSSFASNGQLPNLEGDALWTFLAVATVVPLVVFVGSTLADEHNA